MSTPARAAALAIPIVCRAVRHTLSWPMSAREHDDLGVVGAGRHAEDETGDRDRPVLHPEGDLADGLEQGCTQSSDDDAQGSHAACRVLP